ncbi:uroporphyrinogen decarboxylase family protein [Cloacibacillus evryensis]|uniref:Uroporphyrinogen decarboxylase family protein n=1 Tax=Cloacibacillus evryensis TaxID=508460 RepID=A0AAW5K0Z3_9BACT|nr:uroporphyrinogen decarboxylase family protein [Cloacibacillus evryensis]MCQ4764308.1 uroporphyrinogen decarboxylase family protein [Cloacibacillus evryensis]MCQ4814490.1 uroporphyrinogen decarboxylase family protein [Cloacibacillus evryensis]
MNGKERVLKALHFEEVDRVPWVPFTGVHVAKLVDSNAEELLKNGDILVEAVCTAAERYYADGVCSAFDLQAEAEVLGCALHWSKNNPPAVTGHVLAQGKTLEDLPEFTKDKGRLPMFFEATRKLVEKIGGEKAVFALCCGPFTLALHLRGSAFIMDMMKKPDEAHKVLEYCAEITRRMGEWYMETGAHVVAVVDPMTSQIAPKHFEAFVTPYMKPVIDEVHGKGGIVTLFCCGNATKNIELMMQSKPDAIAFDEQVDLQFVKDLADKYRVSFEGNIPLTTTLLFGSPRECVADVKKRIETGGRRGYILSPGCDLPYDTPFYNLEAVGKYAATGEEPSETSGFMSLEEALSSAEESGDVFEDVTIEPGKVFIEIVTLDSEGCAPCQYMCEAVKNVAPRYGDRLTWRESLIKSAAGIKRTMALGVATLPTLLINNEVVFDNITPTEDALIKEIEKRL